MTSSNKSRKEPPLLGDDSKLSFASYGTWKMKFSCHLADKRCGIYEQLDDVMPRAYPPEPRAGAQKLLWTKTCEKLKYRYHIENEYQLEEISLKAYSSLHHAVSENAKRTEV
jgi:hypothetical protein